MKFTVNGKARELEGAPTVADYLRHLGVNPLAVGVITPSPLRGAVEVGKVIEPLYVPSPVATSVPP